MIAFRESPTAINKRYKRRSDIDTNRIIIFLNNNCCDQIDATRIVFYSCCYGYWRSDEMLRNLHAQAQPVMHDFARRMVSCGNYSLIPNNALYSPTITHARLSLPPNTFWPGDRTMACLHSFMCRSRGWRRRHQI
jgi:hypothetical protein